MCPACLASAAWLFAGTASAGGLTAFAVDRLRLLRKSDANRIDTQPGPASRNEHREPQHREPQAGVAS